MCQRRRLDFTDLDGKFFERGFVILDQRIEQLLRNAIRRTGHTERAFHAHVLDLCDRAQRHGVVSDEEVFPEKEV